jgi:UDP-3-O-[3-hydroxymyristoyl] N-acetylglucosamine deacetylase
MFFSEDYGKRRQNTLARPVEFSGIGIHTGENVKMRFCPAPANAGIVFNRTDLKEQPFLKASLENVLDTSRSTILGTGSVKVHTVEHVLSALKAYQVDNLYIELDNLEPPVGNGSADVFVEMIEEAGLAVQQAEKRIYALKKPIYYSEGEISLVALPSEKPRYSYTLSYPGHPLLHAQFFSGELTPESFKKEIAPCRTFSLYQEISHLIDRGLIRGGSLDNAVVILDKVAFSKEGLFFPDEMVRHKVLDTIGDLSLMGIDLNAHILSIRAGHTTNYRFAKKIVEGLQKIEVNP